MASFQKPRQVGGVFSSLRTFASSAVTAPVVPVSTRLQAVTPNATTKINTLKRRRDDAAELDDVRPAKQARRDSAVDSQIVRLHNLVRPPPVKASRARTLVENSYRKDMLALEGDLNQRAREVEGAIARSEAGKKRVSSEIWPKVSGSMKASDDKVYNKKKDDAERKKLETEQKARAAESNVPKLQGSEVKIEQTSPPVVEFTDLPKYIERSSSAQKLQIELEVERETNRSKSAQVLRLINTNTEQKEKTREVVNDLTTKLEQSVEALARSNQAVSALEKQKKEIELSKDEEIRRLVAANAQLVQERNDALSRAQTSEAEVIRLNARNDYLQTSAKNAADTEFKTGQMNTDLTAKVKQANVDRDAAIEAQTNAEDDAEAAEANAKHFRSVAAAMIQALYASGADVGDAINLLYTDLDMDSEDDSINTLEWSKYVELPLVGSQGVQTHSTSEQTSQSLADSGPAVFRGRQADNHPATGALRAAAPTQAFTSSGSFGKPSHIGAATNEQGTSTRSKELDNMERSVRGLAQELAVQKRQSSELQAWAAKKEIGEPAAPPLSRNQMAFTQFVDNMVTDKLSNSMQTTSSGETARMSHANGDIGMSEAPKAFGPDLYASAYVDFANAETFGPDGYPMATEGNDYRKSVDRQNKQQPFGNKEGKQNGRGGKKDWSNNGGFRPDNNAGKRRGLDVQMGFNNVRDASREEPMMSRPGGGRNQRGNNHNNGSNGNGNGGRRNNQQGNSNGRNNNSNHNRAGNNSGGGQGGRNNGSNQRGNNANSNNGSGRNSNGGGNNGSNGNSDNRGSRDRGNSRGGPRGRGNGRGARGSDDGDDATAGASDLNNGSAPDLMDTGQMTLGHHPTDHTLEELHERGRRAKLARVRAAQDEHEGDAQAGVEQDETMTDEDGSLAFSSHMAKPKAAGKKKAFGDMLNKSSAIHKPEPMTPQQRKVLASLTQIINEGREQASKTKKKTKVTMQAPSGNFNHYATARAENDLRRQVSKPHRR